MTLEERIQEMKRRILVYWRPPDTCGEAYDEWAEGLANHIIRNQAQIEDAAEALKPFK